MPSNITNIHIYIHTHIHTNRSLIKDWQAKQILTEQSLAVLNALQHTVVTAGLGLTMSISAMNVLSNAMTVGEFVMVNTYILQVNPFVCLCVCVCVCARVCVYIYIYIILPIVFMYLRTYLYMHVYNYIYLYILFIYLYYTERERERERHTYICMYIMTINSYIDIVELFYRLHLCVYVHTYVCMYITTNQFLH